MRYKMSSSCNPPLSLVLSRSSPGIRYKMTSPGLPGGCNNWGAIFCVVHHLTTEGFSMHKRPISLAKLRKVPQQFSWVDQRLVRERYIDQLSPQACALYLLLVTVADAQGLSYYADPSLCQRSSLTGTELHQARQALITLGLIAYHCPLYQVLALDAAPTGATPSVSTGAADDEPVDIKAVFTRIWEVLA
jgi:hypothetical protein